MPRGGQRANSGAKSLWCHTPTKQIRVPAIFADQLLDIAKVLDNHDSIDLAYEILDSAMGTLSLSDQIFGKHSVEIYSQDMNRKLGIEGLYYITHIDNLESILHRGILSHNEITKSNFSCRKIYNQQVIDRRKEKKLPNGIPLWDYANLYFQPRNAMLYSLNFKKELEDKLVILSIKRNVVDRTSDIFITDGNAASSETSFYSLKSIQAPADKTIWKDLRDNIDKDWWNLENGSKRKIMAECLVPKKVAPSYIQGIYVPNQPVATKVNDIIASSNTLSRREINVIIEPQKFFQPNSRTRIHRNLYLAEGDLFFSRMQTLTISVNCVGVMGAGLASTGKTRFPDMYVKYQDLCKHKKLAYGLPYVYKRESSVFRDLADEHLPLEDIESALQTWFLLFPTKDHWKKKSSIDGIEKGLMWLVKNYKLQRIESLAIPALGCGKGGLNWDVIGKLMCKYLIQMDIPVVIYLPTEKSIPIEQKQPDFLLSNLEF